MGTAFFKKYNSFVKGKWRGHSIKGIIDKIINKEKISHFEFSIVYKKFLKFFPPSEYEYIYIYRLNKVLSLNPATKYDNLIVIGFGNNLPYVVKDGLDISSLIFCVNLFWLYAKFKFLN